MSQPCVIGIDIGTGSTKAVAVSLTGEVVGTTQTVYPPSTLPAGEQDAEQVFQSFKQCLKDIVANVHAPVKTVSLSSAMHSLLAVDREGKPLTNALLWSDTRSSAVARQLRSTVEGKVIYSATGTPLHAMSPLCKIRWIKDSDPSVFSTAHKFISIKEYIWHRLFGEYEIDHSLASATGLFNISSFNWEAAALAFAGISSKQLSTPVSTSYQRAGLSAALAAELALPVNTIFCIGGSDGCLANLGSGCLDASTAAVTIGTSAAVRITTDKPIVDDARMIFNYRLDEVLFVCGGAVNNGGNVLEWLVKNFVQTTNGGTGYEQLFASIRSVPAGCNGLLFLPYLYGERAPVWDEESCGVYFGIKASHRQAHFVRAAMEGVCFALNHILSALERSSTSIAQIVLSGGGGKPFAQLLADVTGKEIAINDSADSSALGAAYLGLESAGVVDDYTTLPQLKGKSFKPVAENVRVYQKLFAVYKTLYPSLKDAMRKLHTIANE